MLKFATGIAGVRGFQYSLRDSHTQQGESRLSLFDLPGLETFRELRNF